MLADGSLDEDDLRRRGPGAVARFDVLIHGQGRVKPAWGFLGPKQSAYLAFARWRHSAMLQPVFEKSKPV
jgi:hypothetical protein